MGLELRRGDFFACIFSAKRFHRLHEHIVAQKLAQLVKEQDAFTLGHAIPFVASDVRLNFRQRHFFTGPTPALKTAWRDYNIAVEAPNPDADIVHTSALYFIDAQGREAFLASPMVDHTKKGTAFLPAKQVAQWATGIALIARHLATPAG